jgi:hypothetical protein
MRHRVFYTPESYQDPEDQHVRRQNTEPHKEKHIHWWGPAFIGIVFLWTMWLLAIVFSYSNGPVRNLR